MNEAARPALAVDDGPAATRSPAATAAALTAEMDRLLACVHCGFCLDACPTYTRIGLENDSPRGRLYLMRAVAEGRVQPGSDAFQRHLDRCLGCRACEPVCPSGVEYGFLLERSREVIAAARGVPHRQKMLLATFGNPVLNAFAGLLGRFLRGSGLARIAVRWLPARFSRVRLAMAMLEASRPWNGLGRSHDQPTRPARRPQRNESTTLANDLPAEPHPTASEAPPENGPGAPPAKAVATFKGCVQATLFQRVNTATDLVLRHNGCRVVEVVGQRCCGALHAHSGALEEARALARRNLEAFAPFVTATAPEPLHAIIVNAAGCGAMMKDYGKLFEGKPEHELAVAVASRVRDPAVFLAEHGVLSGAPVEVRAAWDSPCHLIHGQLAGTTPLDVLRTAVPGLEVVPVPHAEECCGAAGVHALVHSGDDHGVLADKVSALLSVMPEVGLTANPGCMMQIGAGLILTGHAIPMLHPLELMAESYRRPS